MLTYLALGLVLLRQEPAGQANFSAKVSFTCDPIRVENLLPRLQKLVNKPLLFDGATKNEVVVIRVKNVSGAELLTRLASVCSAQWKEEGQAYRLVRPAAIDEQEAANELKMRTADISSALAEIAGRKSDRLTFTPATAKQFAADLLGAFERTTLDEHGLLSSESEYGKLASNLPIDRAARRIYGMLDAKMIAALPPGKWVFSNRPTRMQLALPPQATSVFNDLVRDQNFLAPYLPLTRVDGDSGEFKFRPFAEPIPAGSKFLLTVSVGAFPELPSVELDAVGPDGDEIAGDGRSLIPEAEDKSIREDDPVTPPSGPKVPLPADLREFVRLLRDDSPTPVTKELREKLLNPELHDPAGFSFFRLLPGYAEVKSLNLVGRVCTPEEDVMKDLPVESKEVFASELMKQLSVTADVTEDSGWLTVKPKFPYHERRLQFDRAILGHALREVARKRVLTFDELAVANTHYSGDQYIMGMFNHSLWIVEQEFYALNIGSDPRVNAFYVSLEPRQRDALKSDAGLSVMALSGVQRQLADYLVFRTDALSMRATADEKQRLQGEITELLPFGLAPRTVIRLTAKPTPGYLSKTAWSNTWMAGQESTIANLFLHPERDPEANPATNRFLPATIVMWQLRVEVPSDKVLTTQSRSYELDPKAKEVKYAELPEELRKKVQDLVVKLRASRKNRPPDDPPPPR